MVVLMLCPHAWAKNVKVVAPNGTLYSVDVVASTEGSNSKGTALAYSRITLDGSHWEGVIHPTQDAANDRDPVLLLGPEASGPFLIWSRKNGRFDQLAFSRFEDGAWSQPTYLTDSPAQHLRPSAGVDAFGTGYLIWIEPTGGGRVMFATFDPGTGNLLSSPRDFFLELVRHSPAQWLAQDLLNPRVHGNPRIDDPGILPDGGAEVPVVPPANSNPHVDEPVNGSVTLTPTCSKAVGAIVRNRALWIGVMQNGVVLEYYRSVVPVGAPEDYVSLLLQSILNQSCQ
jgi:hypothetical protein